MKTPKASKKKPRSETENPVVSIQMPREMMDKIDAIAANDERSRSWLIRKLLTDAVAAHLLSKPLESLPDQSASLLKRA